MCTFVRLRVRAPKDGYVIWEIPASVGALQTNLISIKMYTILNNKVDVVRAVCAGRKSVGGLYNEGTEVKRL